MREEVQDRFGNTIYVTDERWQHIFTNHHQLRGRQHEILSTIRSGKRSRDPSLLDKFYYTKPFLFKGRLKLIEVVCSSGGATINQIISFSQLIHGDSGATMFFSYDSEGDVLEVIFEEDLHNADQMAYELRKGIVLYLTVKEFKLVQLTLVSYRELSQMPVVDFTEWRKLSASVRKRLLPIVTSPTITNFLKLDPKTGAGHVIFPARSEAFSMAA